MRVQTKIFLCLLAMPFMLATGVVALVPFFPGSVIFPPSVYLWALRVSWVIWLGTWVGLLLEAADGSHGRGRMRLVREKCGEAK